MFLGPVEVVSIFSYTFMDTKLKTKFVSRSGKRGRMLHDASKLMMSSLLIGRSPCALMGPSKEVTPSDQFFHFILPKVVIRRITPRLASTWSSEAA
jgi:hypothetical protein